MAFRRSDALHPSENGSGLVDRVCQLIVFVVHPVVALIASLASRIRKK
jgi:hypothetical protein